MKKNTTLIPLITFIIVSLCMPSLYAKRQKLFVSPPDLRVDQKTDGSHDWTLGPTGARGWVWTQKISQGSTKGARQILITKVEKGSPSDGKLEPGDVILGVNKKDFTSDARKAFANAITEAEKTENAGRLSLKRWRSGKVKDVVLTLKVMGSFSDTSPYNCEKTKAIIDMACDHMKDRELKDELFDSINALGILATGRDDLLPMVRKFAHEICKPGEVLDLDYHESLVSWKWSYKCLFLAEYYLRTGDKYVLPTIKEYATKIAMGQSGVGTWGHAMATREYTGELHRYLGGYGAINQTGLTCMMSLALAEKCGIRNAEISQAIKKGDIFFSYYIGKGSIPYGDHGPRTAYFDDNGKSAAGAVMFDLMDKREGAEFFSAMTVAHAPGGREDGHTGNFWGHLWGGIGAARSGQEGLATFFKEMRWYFELERGWKGNVRYQRNPGDKQTDKEGWDCTGARLLQLCLPLKQLCITGKDMKVINPLGGTILSQAIEAGRLIGNPEKLKELDKEKILQMLAHPLPATRNYGAQALAVQNINCVNDLIRMLESDHVNARYGACQALRVAGFNSKKAVERLSKIMLESDDLTFRLYAIDALTGGDLKMGLAKAAKPVIPALLKLAVSRSDDDPRRLLQRKLGFALFYKGRIMGTTGLISHHGVEGLEQSLLIPAIKELLTVDDGRSRSTVTLVYSMLNAADLKLLWDDIYLSVKIIAPSGIMFADGVRLKGLKLMQQHHFKEGVELAIVILKENRWGGSKRLSAILPILAEYGGSAKAALPILKELKEHGLKPYSKKKRKAFGQLDLLNKTIKSIETGEPHPLDSMR
jgi:hypothetical protein